MKIQRLELSKEQVKEALTQYLNNVVFKEPVSIKEWEALSRGAFGECEEVRVTLQEKANENA